MDFFDGLPCNCSSNKEVQQIEEENVHFENWANLPNNIYPSFDKQAVSEVNANLFKGSMVTICVFL